MPALYAIVDSGADKSLFPKGLMTALGIDDATECSDVPGTAADGLVNYREWAGGPKNWNGGKLKTNVMGVDLSLNAWFAGCPIILLGREDFFAHFKVTFDERKKQFRLEAY